MKKCSKCGLPKPPEDFHKDSKGKLDSEGVRRSAACKTCKNSRRAKTAPVEPSKLLLSYEFNIFKTQRSDVEIVIRKPHIRAQGATVDDVIAKAVEKLRGWFQYRYVYTVLTYSPTIFMFDEAEEVTTEVPEEVAEEEAVEDSEEEATE